MIDTARVSQRDNWVNCNSCFIFALRKKKNINESCQFVKFSVDSAQMFLFLFCFFFHLAAFYGLPRVFSG